MNISTLEKRTGLSRDTIRFYEKEGIITAPKRSDNGYRIYTELHVKQLSFVSNGKAIGFSLSEIQAGYRTLIELGKLCPNLESALFAKKDYFLNRIESDRKKVAIIEEMLKRKSDNREE